MIFSCLFFFTFCKILVSSKFPALTFCSPDTIILVISSGLTYLIWFREALQLELSSLKWNHTLVNTYIHYIYIYMLKKFLGLFDVFYSFTNMKSMTSTLGSKNSWPDCPFLPLFPFLCKSVTIQTYIAKVHLWSFFFLPSSFSFKYVDIQETPNKMYHSFEFISTCKNKLAPAQLMVNLKDLNLLSYLW